MAPAGELFIGSAFIGVSNFLVYMASRLREEVKKELVGEVSKIIIYPVKSVPGVCVDSCVLTYTGVQSGNLVDRVFMFIKKDGGFITQRTHPKLANVNVVVMKHGLKLQAPEIEDLFLPFKPASNAMQVMVRLRTSRMTALDCGEVAASWAERYLDLPGGRVVQADPVLTTRPAVVSPHLKKYNRRPQDYINFQDHVPVHLMSSASIEEVNKHIDPPVDERNFRPNILVSGSTPFDEDEWLNIFIRDTQMHAMWMDDRCKMTQVDPNKGVFRPDKQPLQGLAKFRSKEGHITPCLGICAGTDVEGILKVGDKVYAERGSVP